VQIVFQDPYTSLDPRQNAEATIDEVLRLHHGWPAERRRARVTELTGLVGLDARQSRALPRSLSGGLRQRVAIDRALAAQPAVLILDESVASLDVSIQAQVLNLLADIRDPTATGERASARLETRAPRTARASGPLNLAATMQWLVRIMAVDTSLWAAADYLF
jgi:ABC-type dipeptide/oligopeptide/nickel transport system ATPase subunit